MAPAIVELGAPQLVGRIAIICGGAAFLLVNVAIAASYRGWVVRESAALHPEGAQRPFGYWAKSRPIVLRLLHCFFALIGLFFASGAALGQYWKTPLGGAVLGTIVALLLLDLVALIVISNWLDIKHRREMKALRGRGAGED